MPISSTALVCKSGSGVDQRRSALARCLADLVTAHTGAKVHSEQTIPGSITGAPAGAQPEGARTDIVFNLRGHTCAGLISAVSSRRGYMAKPEGKKKFDRYPRINLASTHICSSNFFSAIRTTHHPDHPAQTTTPSRHHLTPGSSSPAFHTHPSRALTTHNIPCHALMPDTRSSTSMADHHQSLRSALWSHRAADVGYTQRELKGRAHAPGFYRLRGKARGTCRWSWLDGAGLNARG